MPDPVAECLVYTEPSTEGIVLDWVSRMRRLSGGHSVLPVSSFAGLNSISANKVDALSIYTSDFAEFFSAVRSGLALIYVANAEISLSKHSQDLSTEVNCCLFTSV